MSILESYEQDAKNIASDIILLVISDKFNQIVKRLTLEEWRDFIAYFINQEIAGGILNDKIISAKLNELERMRPFSKIFKEGKEYFVMIMPCDLAGNPRSASDQRDGDYVVFLELPSKEDAGNGVLKSHALLRDFMPPEIARDCVFIVEKYISSPDGEDDEAHKMRAAVLAKCAQAMLKLRLHFEGKPVVQN